MKILIVGGGVAGLVAGVNFSLHGFEVCLLEKRDGLERFGALQISPNGVKILEKIGLADSLDGFLPPAIDMRCGKSGKVIFSLPMLNVARRRWGADYMQVERNSLISALLEKFNGEIKFGCEVVSMAEKFVLLANGEKIYFDLLVGADGLNSLLRKKIFPDVENKFSGYYAWRAQVPVHKLSAPPANSCIWTGWRSHVVTSLICDGSVLNFVAIGRKDIDAFASWHPTIKNIIDFAPDMQRWKIFTTPSLPRSPLENVVLIGDAWHTLLPSQAQGGVMAIEDGFVLSEMIATGKSIKEFENLRRPRINMVRRMSAFNFHLFHYGRALHLPLSIVGKFMPEIFYARLDKLYGYFFHNYP